MANNKQKQDTDQTTRGGTQGNGPAPMQPGGTPGGTNAISPTGAARPIGRTPEPPTGDKASAQRQDPQRAVEDGRTKPSEDAAAQRARDEADVAESEPGHDEGNPKQIPEDAPTPDDRAEND